MMLTKREQADVQRLIGQSANDVAYMLQWADDPNSHLTRGMAERHAAMARYLLMLLEHIELAQA